MSRDQDVTALVTMIRGKGYSMADARQLIEIAGRGTLRDLLAMSALPQVLVYYTDTDTAAAYAYEVADAMLKERLKEIDGLT